MSLTRKWAGSPLLLALAILSLYLAVNCAFLTHYTYLDWMSLIYSGPERLYESIYMFYAHLQFLILFVTILGLSCFRLVQTLRPGRMPRNCIAFVQQRGLRLALGFSALFVLLFLLNRAAQGRIANTEEIYEVPAAVSDYVLKGNLQIGAELSAEAAVISVISWLRCRKEKTNE